MLFTYSEWERFCKSLDEKHIHSVTSLSLICDIPHADRFVTIKHDVESLPKKALDIARIEAHYGHQSSYYVQPSLMREANAAIFQEIQKLGHEVSYHHSVIDAARGDISVAIKLYQNDLKLFKKFGFDVRTVCQHGNPASIYDNRDFFKSSEVKEIYHDQTDIMADFKNKIGVPYTYISDFGMLFKKVNDPTHDKNMSADEEYEDIGSIDKVLNTIFENPSISYIVSAHPHRYSRFAALARARKILFKFLRMMAKILFIIPGIKILVFNNNKLIRYI